MPTIGFIQALGRTSDPEWRRRKSDLTKARSALVARIVAEDGKASQAQRRAAFDNTVVGAPLST